MAMFADHQRKYLEPFCDFRHGTPSHDTFGKVLNRLDPRMLSERFNAWMSELYFHLGKLVESKGMTVAIDGTTIRHSYSAAQKASHVVTTFASRMQLVLGQVKSDEKSNEITAIPELLDLFQVKDTVSPGICTANSKTQTQESSKPKDSTPAPWSTLEKDHGRVESETSKTITEDHYFIYSLKETQAQDLLRIKREHWAIESNLRWMLDMAFREDDCRARAKNAAEVMNILRKLALQMLKACSTCKCGMRSKRKLCRLGIPTAL